MWIIRILFVLPSLPSARVFRMVNSVLFSVKMEGEVEGNDLLYLPIWVGKLLLTLSVNTPIFSLENQVGSYLESCPRHSVSWKVLSLDFFLCF